MNRLDLTPDMFPATLPSAPRPTRRCVPRTPQWAMAREFCDRMLNARDPREKAEYRSRMVRAMVKR